MSNLIDGIKGYLTDSLLDQVGNALGESKTSVGTAAAGLIPSILGGLVNKAGDSSAFGSLFNTINEKADPSWLDNLGGFINQGNLAHNDPKDIAGQFMGSLFGNKVGGLLSGLGSLAGFKNAGSSSALLGLVGPLVLGYLKKRILGDGLNAGSLATLLLGEKDGIMKAIPGALGSVLGFSTPSMPSAATASTGGSSMWKWLLPLLLLGAAAFYFMRNCQPKEAAEQASAAMDSAASATGDAMDKAGDMAADAADKVAAMFSRELEGGVKIEGSATGIESQLIAFIEDASKPVDKTTWFNFDALNFKTASAELDMAYSQKQLDNIAAILKAFPKVKIKIGGYTDSDGDDASNMKLSTARANNVMAALVAKGIDAARLAAEGYGEQHPVCPANDTPECKAQNRRIAVRVTEK